MQRRFVECLALLALLFVLQASFVPFDFAFSTSDAGSRAYFDFSVGRLTLPDIISNIFLYTPIGALGFWTLRRRGWSRIVSVLAVMVAGAGLTVAVEHLQFFSPSRVSSLIDVVSNVVGVAVGVTLSFVCQFLIPRVVESIAREFRSQPRVAIVKSYVVLLVMFASMPFAFSFDTNRLKESIKAANFMPFATANWEDTTHDAPTLSAAHATEDYRRWTALRSWSRWALEFAAFAVFAWLVHSMCVRHYGFTRRATNWLTWWFAIALAMGLSVLHIPLMMRDFDVTDVMFRFLGVAVGVVVRSVLLDTRSGGTRSLAPETQRFLGHAAITTAVMFIVYTGLVPLTFSMPEGGVGAEMSATEFLPFMAYFVTRFDLMMTDVMEKFASYAVLAALLARFWRRAATMSTYRTTITAAYVCVLLSCAIEVAQLFIRVRVVSLTDPILAAVGAVIGVTTQAKFMAFYRHVTDAPQPNVTGGAVARDPAPLGPTDALIATLTETRDDAPREPSPQRRYAPHE